MCRGFQQNERDRLKIKAFYVHLAAVSTSAQKDCLTLHYLPRINGSALEINGSNIRPDSPAFVTLHRVVSSAEAEIETIAKGVVYGSRDRVKASEGLRFEIYMGNDVKVLKGIFRKDEGQNWKVECTCGLEGDDVEEIKEAEVCVGLEGHVAMISEKVDMVIMRRKRSRIRCINKLEEIPEEREVDQIQSDQRCCCCCECKGEEEMDSGGDCEMEEMDGVRWAVDVGIWVVCLGVGYLVTRASSKSLRRRRPRFI